MNNALRVVLEIGPKGKRVVAGATDWPGLDRWGKDEEGALATLHSYRSRYAPVAERAHGGRVRPRGAHGCRRALPGKHLDRLVGHRARSVRGRAGGPRARRAGAAPIPAGRVLELLRRRRRAGLGRAAPRAAWRRLDTGRDRPSCPRQRGRAVHTQGRGANAARGRADLRRTRGAPGRDARRHPRLQRRRKDRGALLVHPVPHPPHRASLLDHAWEMEDRDLQRSSSGQI
jgi:hypothetical protein